MDASNPIDATPCTSLTNPPADSKCASCLLASCCTVTNTCLGDPDCAALVACIKVCKADGSSSNDKSCIAACFKAHPNSVNAGADYDNCRLMSCAMQCP